MKSTFIFVRITLWFVWWKYLNNKTVFVDKNVMCSLVMLELHIEKLSYYFESLFFMKLEEYNFKPTLHFNDIYLQTT